MNPILRNIIAVIAGAILGGIVNSGIIMISGSIIPPPEGVDPSDMESLKSNIHLFSPKHFVMPFLAHAIGTFVGALIAAFIAAKRKMLMALIVGFLFLIGGIYMAILLPSPIWFILVDLFLAYIPMAWIGGMIALQLKNNQ